MPRHVHSAAGVLSRVGAWAYYTFCFLPSVNAFLYKRKIHIPYMGPGPAAAIRPSAPM